MSADKYPSIFSRQMKAIVYICLVFTYISGTIKDDASILSYSEFRA